MWKNFRVIMFNNKTWIRNLEYMIISTIILGIVILFDTRTVDIEQYIPRLFLTTVGLATTILSALAGALLSMTVFTFSTIMTIVSFYSSNYTSSTIDDFVKSDIILKVLGIFISGFFYCVSALLFMRDTYEHDSVIAGSIGVIYALVCVVFFIRFVQQILYSVQSTNVVKEIYNDAYKLIKQNVEARRNITNAVPSESCEKIPVYARNTGYVSAIYYELMSAQLVKRNAVLKINAKIGDFTVEGARIGVVYAENAGEDYNKLSQYFVIQDAQIPEMDFHYRKTQLIDIALKSLPPGNADLNSGVHCIRKLSVLMAELMKVDGEYIDVGANARNIIYKSATIEEELYLAYNQIIPNGEREISIVLALLDGFYTMYRTATPKNKRMIKEFVQNFYERIKGNFPDKYDQHHLQHTYEKIMQH